MRISLYSFALLVTSAVTMVSCRSSHKSVEQAQSAEVVSQTSASIAEKILDHTHLSWDNLQVPVTIKLRSPQSVSISGTMIMSRNHDLLISLRYWGIEIGVLYLDDNNVVVLDKVHKKYVEEPVDKFLDGFNVSIDNVQDMLLGRLFVLGSEVTASQVKRADIEQLSSSYWCFVPSNSTQSVNYGFTIDNDAWPTGMIVCVPPHQPVTIKYDRTAGKDMAQAISIDYQTGKLHIDASIEYNLSKIKYGNDVKLRKVTPPDNYQRIVTSELSKMIKF